MISMTNEFTTTINPDSSLLTDSLYQLESVFSQKCSGHGCGLGQTEDIHFRFPDESERELTISRSGAQLKISAGHLVGDDWQDIDLTMVPLIMKRQLVVLLRKHTTGQIPEELLS
jgi:hypothetical protein